MDEISTHSHNLIIDDDGSLIINQEGKCIVSRIRDGHLVAVEPDIIKNVFGVSFSSHEENYLPSPNVKDNVNSVNNLESDDTVETESLHDGTDRTSWSRSNILKLIDLYKQHSNLFNSTTVRNEKVWGMISKEMKLYSTEQCKNKFKYLKGKYIKKKDNMSAKATGQRRVVFEYYEEFDDIFGNHPNISPISIASSSKDIQQGCTLSNVACIDSGEDIATDSEHNRSKRRKVNDKENIEVKPKLTVAGQLKKIAEELKEREKNRERRHKELLAQREQGTQILNKYLTYIMKDKNT